MFLAPTLFLDRDHRQARGPVAATVALNLVVACGYVLTGYAGLELAFVGHTVTLFWAPSGIAFAAIWIGGRRLAPGVAAGAVVVNLVTGLPLAPTLLVGLGNTLEALIAVFLVSQAIARDPGLGESRRVVWFVLLAVIGATLVSATIGTLAVQWFSVLARVPRWTFSIWWLGDAMGTLIVAPPILLWHRLAAARSRPRDLLHAAGFAAIGLCLVVCQVLIPVPVWGLELFKLLMVMLSLAAGARFGLAGPAMVTVVTAIGAVLVTALGTGPFTQGNFYDRLAEVHAFLFTTAVAGMLLAAIMADLHRSVRRERDAQEALAAASASRIRMLTLISHDLRTPLGAMTTVLETLRRPGPDTERERLVDAGLGAGTTIGTLVNDILATARLDQGQIALDPAPFDLRLSLAQIVARHRRNADAKQVALTLDIDPGVPAAFLGDRVRVEQIIDNLVSNAVSFTDAGRVAVECRYADRLSVSVSDTGVGVRPALAPLIFDAFVKAQPGERSGLGLGLHICRGLAGLMGGTVTYHPAEPHGSRFALTLPLPVAPPLSAEATAPTIVEPLPILLVEDDPISREITAAWLASQGHRVTTAADGERAVALATTGDFRVVLVDDDLGSGMSGRAVASAIRRLPLPIATVPIIALTGTVSDDATAALRSSGVDHILHKPLPLTTHLTALFGTM